MVLQVTETSTWSALETIHSHRPISVKQSRKDSESCSSYEIKMIERRMVLSLDSDSF